MARVSSSSGAKCWPSHTELILDFDLVHCLVSTRRRCLSSPQVIPVGSATAFPSVWGLSFSGCCKGTPGASWVTSSVMAGAVPTGYLCHRATWMAEIWGHTAQQRVDSPQQCWTRLVWAWPGAPAPRELTSRAGQAGRHTGLQARGWVEQADQGPRDSSGERLSSQKIHLSFQPLRTQTRNLTLKTEGNKHGF